MLKQVRIPVYGIAERGRLIPTYNVPMVSTLFVSHYTAHSSAAKISETTFIDYQIVNGELMVDERTHQYWDMLATIPIPYGLSFTYEPVVGDFFTEPLWFRNNTKKSFAYSFELALPPSCDKTRRALASIALFR